MDDEQLHFLYGLSGLIAQTKFATPISMDAHAAIRAELEQRGISTLQPFDDSDDNQKVKSWLKNKQEQTRIKDKAAREQQAKDAKLSY